MFIQKQRLKGLLYLSSGPQISILLPGGVKKTCLAYVALSALLGGHGCLGHCGEMESMHSMECLQTYERSCENLQKFNGFQLNIS